MDTQNVVAALIRQNQRFNDIVRNIDHGIWWGSDPAAKLDFDALLAQSEHIRIALDEIVRLSRRITDGEHARATEPNSSVAARSDRDRSEDPGRA